MRQGLPLRGTPDSPNLEYCHGQCSPMPELRGVRGRLPQQSQPGAQLASRPDFGDAGRGHMIDIQFTDRVNSLSEQTVQMCYHCHKCTAGCPVASEMAYGPDRILRMVQFGEKDKLLGSHDIWLCASCETCGARCPNEIDIARVMDALRQIAIQEGAA
ncbi:MAG: hypothetical protein EHM70_22350, partial [Chloroflexota bacterium]